MLPAPARDDAAQALAKIRRIADSARTRRLDMLEHLWKGTAWDERPSFWDASIPLNERGTCVQSGIAESSGGRIVNLVFGNARFPSLTLAKRSAYGQAFTDDERTIIGDLVAAIVDAARLRTTMRAAFEQGLMCGTLVAVMGLRRGEPDVTLLPAKYCERELDAAGDVARLEYRYRYDTQNERGEDVTVWYRRVIDAQSDSVWEGVPVDREGYLPEWDKFRPTSVTAHGLGFCPVIWHRNRPDVSDTDPIDGTALFDGLEDEIFALDMAMSQRHRNGRYNGEPQVVRIGFGDASMGETGRDARPMPDLGKDGKGATSWFSRAYDAAGRYLNNVGASTKKAPGKIWNAPAGADVKMLESTGAGAQILASDIDGLRATILEARSIVIASPETLSANASAALLRQIFEPMLGTADNYREEYGDVLRAIVNMLLRVCYTMARRGLSVFVPGFADALYVLQRATVAMSDGSTRWVGLQFDLAWGEYFEPTWADMQAALAAAGVGNGGEPVLSLAQSVRMVAPVVGITNVDRYLDELTGHNAASHAAARDMLASVADASASTQAPEVVADTAMNGAQVASLQGIVTAAAAGELPVETARAMITAAFPALAAATIDAMLAPIGQVAGIAAQHADLQAEHAALKASHASKSRMLDNVLAHNAAGKLVQGSPVGLGAPDAPSDASE